MIKPELIKSLREKQGFSQEHMAEQLKLSRPSYALVESGEKEPTLSQAKILAELIGITLDSFIEGKPVPVSDVMLGKDAEAKSEQETTMRVNVPQKNLAKFKEVLLYILEKVGGKPNVGMAVLYKLLYFVDFDYYEKYEEQLVGATYIKNHFGPTPVEFAKISSAMIEKGELEKVKSTYFTMEQTKYLPRRKPDLSKLSGQEIKHIDDVLARLSDKNAAEMKDYSHKDVPWIVALDGKPIDYESALYRSAETSVRDYKDGEADCL